MNRYAALGLRCPACDTLLTKREKVMYADTDGYCRKCDDVTREILEEMMRPAKLKKWIDAGIKRGIFDDTIRRNYDEIYGDETTL